MKKIELIITVQILFFSMLLTACGSNEATQSKSENTASTLVVTTSIATTVAVSTPTLAIPLTNTVASTSTSSIINRISNPPITVGTFDDILLYLSRNQVIEIAVDPAFATQYGKVIGGQYKRLKYFVSDVDLPNFQPNFEKYLSSMGFVGGFSPITQSPYEGVASFYRAGNSSIIIGILTNMDGYIALLESDNTFSYQVMQDFIQNLKGKKMFLYILEP